MCLCVVGSGVLIELKMKAQKCILFFDYNNVKIQNDTNFFSKDYICLYKNEGKRGTSFQL